MIVFFNPLSTTPGKQPLPLSIMALASVIEGRYPWTLVDGNVTPDPAAEIIARFRSRSAPDAGRRPGEIREEDGPDVLAVTVMPGPQLTQAVPVCRKVHEALPGIRIVWGGYFPTQHTDTVLASPFVDFVVRSQGESPLVSLIQAIESNGPFDSVSNLSWKRGDGRIVHNPLGQSVALDELPDFPYARVRMDDYIHPTYLGARTVAHNSSFGCPFACSFCAVVAMSNRRWLAQSPERLERTIRTLTSTYGADAVQMHDMDFFISEARVAEFAERIADLGIHWWALGRVDTLMQYSERTWKLMARSGLKMVFSGAESASDEVLAAMNKGGKSSARLAIELAARMRRHGVVPEYSFVLGSPPDPEGDMETTFEYIRKIKRVNPATEIVLYTYTPVPMEGTLYREASKRGFAFPTSLDAWASNEWKQLMMRRGDGIPWIDGDVRRQVRNFERVLNAFYPTITDRRLTPARRALLKVVSGWRYALRMYAAPYELRALHRLIHYQRPETTGF
jgi:hypothetical protein